MKIDQFKTMISKHAADIMLSEGIQTEKKCIQHGDVTVFEHSIHVVYLSIRLANLLGLQVNMRALIRGALLHDYFLYDWHIPSDSHKLHGFRHAKFALQNACRDFKLSDIEKDIIRKHMFPLNPALPKYKESVIVSTADKISAVCEMLSGEWARKRLKSLEICKYSDRISPILLSRHTISYSKRTG